MSEDRTVEVVDEEMEELQQRLGELAKKKRQLQTDCEHRLNAIHVHPHQKKAWKKCASCNKSTMLDIPSYQFNKEVESWGES